MWAKLQVEEIDEKDNINRVFQNYMNRRGKSLRTSSRDRNVHGRYARKFCSRNCTQIGSRAQLASYPLGNWVTYISGRQRERARSEKLAIHISLVPRLTIREAKPPLSTHLHRVVPNETQSQSKTL